MLKGSSPKSRADILSHYIRISKKLYELSNFHSLFAIVSALRSAPVYRSVLLCVRSAYVTNNYCDLSTVVIIVVYMFPRKK